MGTSLNKPFPLEKFFSRYLVYMSFATQLVLETSITHISDHELESFYEIDRQVEWIPIQKNI